MTQKKCPCESGLSYDECCGPLHAGQAAATAEAMMRSRYTAYVMKNVDYIVATTHPKMKPPVVTAEVEEFAESATFLNLEIVRTWYGASKDKMGKVEFIARFLREGNDAAEVIHENSRFKRYKGKWFYSGGDFLD
jgi:SEC-C motif-containing protein